MRQGRWNTFLVSSVDVKGHKKTGTGFAKVLVAKETKQQAQDFVNKAISQNSMVNTDASPSFIHL